MAKKETGTYYAQEICDQFDITKNTLFKWEREGKISPVKKDWRGWRLFSDDNVSEIRKVIDAKMKQNG